MARSKVRICGIEDEQYLKEPSALKVEIQGIEGDPDYLDQLNIELQSLLLTRRGTLPGSRGYGMPLNYLDFATPEAVNELAVELDAALIEWIPEVRLRQVQLIPSELGSVDTIILTLEEA